MHLHANTYAVKIISMHEFIKNLTVIDSAKLSVNNITKELWQNCTYI